MPVSPHHSIAHIYNLYNLKVGKQLSLKPGSDNSGSVNSISSSSWDGRDLNRLYHRNDNRCQIYRFVLCLLKKRRFYQAWFRLGLRRWIQFNAAHIIYGPTINKLVSFPIGAVLWMHCVRGRDYVECPIHDPCFYDGRFFKPLSFTMLVNDTPSSL